MNAEINLIVKKFNEIKSQGWIECEGKGNGVCGLLFETLMGVEKNELEIPDFHGFELKTKNIGSKENYISLFNAVPAGPHFHEIERLRELYGYPDATLAQYKVLNVSLYANTFSKCLANFYFKLHVNRKQKKIFLLVYDSKKKLIENFVYWDFDIIEEKLYRKLKKLAFISVNKKVLNHKRLVWFSKIDFYKIKNFDTFLYLMEKGVIRICLKISVYKDENRLGKTHDRGTSFCIKHENLEKLYNKIAIERNT